MGSTKSVQTQPDLSKQTKSLSKRGLTCGVAAMKGWRNFMEDSHIMHLNLNNNEQLDFFAIFDGHGGCQVSFFMKEEFTKSLIKNESFLRGQYSQALSQTFIKMDELITSDYGTRRIQAIRQIESQKENCYNLSCQLVSGSTALVCLVTSKKVYIANVGDSKAIASVNKQCRKLNRQHLPTQKDEQQRILRAGGSIENGRILGDLNFSRAIGDFHYKEQHDLARKDQMVICDPEITQISRDNLQFILLGCDGIWQNKSEDQMHEWIKNKIKQQSANIPEKLCQLFDEQVSKDWENYRGMDNMTAILIKFQ